MSFTARQQQCLEAMGIVPWVSRIASVVPTDVSDERGVEIEANAPAPVSCAELEAWLATASMHLSGPAEASLLIISEEQKSPLSSSRLPGKTPFNSESNSVVSNS